MEELTAPGIPIAIVATGQPLGICTIEYKLSTPESASDNIGTPITGKKSFDATIPGKCAAPPAPAIITFICLL